MRRFNSLSDYEQRNELLKGIYNHLAAMNKWLDILVVSYAKLSADEVLVLQEHTASLDEGIDNIDMSSLNLRMGCNSKYGLYMTE